MLYIFFQTIHQNLFCFNHMRHRLNMSNPKSKVATKNEVQELKA